MNRKRATIDDLYKVEGKAELVNGEIVHFPPAGDLPGRAGGRIFYSLREYEEHCPGLAYGDNTGFLADLPHRESFCPCAAWYTGPRAGMKFLPQPPDFAVEVRGEDDYGPAAEQAMAEKRADYFAAGTKVVWDVDVQSNDIVRIYRADSPNTPTIYRRGDRAEAEPAVPGWRMEVESLFK